MEALRGFYSPLRDRGYKDHRRPLSVAHRFVYILCGYMCVGAMLASVSFFRNHIRKDVVHPARPVPVAFPLFD